MLKKLCLLALVLCGAAVFAGDRAGIYLLILGDPDEATIEIKSGSPAVKILDQEGYKSQGALSRGVVVDIDEKAPVEIELEFVPSVGRAAMILCRGMGETENDFVYVDCTKFDVEVAGQKLPSKPQAFKSLRPLAPRFRAEAGKPIKVKATLAKATPERIAEIEAAVKKEAQERFAKYQAEKAKREAELKAKQEAEQGEGEQE